MNEEIYTVKMDRPLGSVHPDVPTMVYPVNYGYVEGIMAKDGEEQDAYVLGIDVPLDEFTGKRIAIVHRNDDIEDKWIIVPENIMYTRQQIADMIHFQEQYFDSHIEMVNEEMWDAYDKNEQKLGYLIPRSRAKELEDGKYHVVVMIYTMDYQGRFLTTQRSRNKTNPLKWEVTGGSILSGENAEDGAIRELQEETGICVGKGDMIQIYRNVDDNRHCIYHGFFNYLANNNSCDIILQEGETMNYRFLDYHEFEELVKSDRFVRSEQGRFIKFQKDIERIIDMYMKKKQK